MPWREQAGARAHGHSRQEPHPPPGAPCPRAGSRLRPGRAPARADERPEAEASRNARTNCDGANHLDGALELLRPSDQFRAACAFVREETGST
eukprot:11301645-Alexandrium_andersonii.AAC.1